MQSKLSFKKLTMRLFQPSSPPSASNSVPTDVHLSEARSDDRGDFPGHHKDPTDMLRNMDVNDLISLRVQI